MPTNKELLLSLRDGLEQLEVFDDSGPNALGDRGQMIIRRIFRPNSPCSERLSSIEFHYTGPFVFIPGESETLEQEQIREDIWRSGQRETISLVGTMIEELDLSEPEQVQAVEKPIKPKSNRVFVVNGHDNEMKQAVARSVERIGLEAVILHEQPNQGRTLI